jgi:repressor LexA
MTAPVVPLLTVTQLRVVEVIRAYAVEHGFAPSVREIADLSGLSSSACWYQIGQLARKGWIRRHPNRPRALVVLNPADGSDS